MGGRFTPLSVVGAVFGLLLPPRVSSWPAGAVECHCCEIARAGLLPEDSRAEAILAACVVKRGAGGLKGDESWGPEEGAFVRHLAVVFVID